MQEIQGAKPNCLLPTTQVPHCISDALNLPFKKKKRLIIYTESQSINEVSLISGGAGRVTFHYPARCVVIVQGATERQALQQLSPSSPALTPRATSSKPTAGPASACGFILACRVEGLAVVTAWCHLA